MAPHADRPTRALTLTLTRTLWGDLWLDAVAGEGSRLIRPKGDANGGYTFQKPHTRVSVSYTHLTLPTKA